jgi:hypothetical protein
MPLQLVRSGWLLVLAWAVTPVLATQVDIPLQFDHAFIRQAIIDEVYGSPAQKVSLWDDGTGCGFLRLWDPGVGSAGTRIRLVSRGEGRIGTPVGGICLAPVQWDGFLEIIEEPEISADGNALQFRIVDSNLYDTVWKKPLLTGKLWDLVKPRVQSRFQAVHIDVGSPLRDLRELLPLVAGGDDAARIEALLASLKLSRAEANETGVNVVLSFTVADLGPPPAPVPEPTLTPEELRQWEDAWQRWDAFLTFVVKQIGRDTAAKDLLRALAETLIEARLDIIEALAPVTPESHDPTPALFLKTWERLAPVVRQSAATQPGSVALRYLSFVAAGDALAALEQIGPEVGVEISADGLRRLARIVAPLNLDDPLVYTTEVDPELRALFGLGPPLPPPQLVEPPAEPSSGWPGWLRPRSALAAVEAPSPQRLERWLPTRDQIDTYLVAVREVLQEATDQTLASGQLEGKHHELYRRLVLATAWQESCWRQFIRRAGTVTYIRSPVGSVGLMQINEKVWRGLYDIQGLRWDISYNGRAGADILLHYLQDYAIARNEHTKPGGIDNLIRATYAVYNGGPRHLSRYRRPETSKSLRRIDDLFWEKYEAVRNGRELEVGRCIVGG